MKLCLSIAPISMSEALARMYQVSNLDDLIEIRIDAIKDLDVQRLLKQPRPQLIITNRRSDEGGKFRGNRKIQLAKLSQAIECGAEYIDIEMSCGSKTLHALRKHSGKTKIILSYHNFVNTPKKVQAIYAKMRSFEPDIIKIATTAYDISDNKIIFNLLQKTQSKRIHLIAHCMGERGEISRILSGKFGGYLSFASQNQSSTTAPGQLNIEDMEKIYRVESINKKTKIFGLVGNPVAQSKGIFFHNRIFKLRNLNAVYVNFLVDNIETFIKSFRDIVSGFSVTMPFKEKIIPLLDTLDETAQAVNSVNTVIIKNNKMVGYNTDLLAVNSILKNIPSLKRKKVVILGTGAMAKTMAYSALKHGATTTIVGRSPRKAKSLSSTLGCNWNTFENLRSIEADVLMNATPVGMLGNTAKQIVRKNYLKKEMIIIDAVYTPSLTPLILSAKEKGCRTILGDIIFSHQAQLQSKLFLDSLR
jgi:3-dehydroquinate dehydratase/shikimate dehydrogenase